MFILGNDCPNQVGQHIIHLNLSTCLCIPRRNKGRLTEIATLDCHLQNYSLNTELIEASMT